MISRTLLKRCLNIDSRIVQSLNEDPYSRSLFSITTLCRYLLPMVVSLIVSGAGKSKNKFSMQVQFLFTHLILLLLTLATAKFFIVNILLYPFIVVLGVLSEANI